MKNKAEQFMMRKLIENYFEENYLIFFLKEEERSTWDTWILIFNDENNSIPFQIFSKVTIY